MGYALTMTACMGAANEIDFISILALTPQAYQDTLQRMVMIKQGHIKIKDLFDTEVDYELHEACDKEDFERMRPLIMNRGANVNSKNIRNESVLLCVASWHEIKNKVAALDLVIRYGGNIHAQTDLLETGLHRACARLDVESVYFLLAKGINYKMADYTLNTALHKACSYDHKGLITLLTGVHDLDALLEMKNKAGQTPMDFVKKNDHNDDDDEIVVLLNKQKALSRAPYDLVKGFTRKHESYVVTSIVHFIVSFLLFQRLGNT